MAKNEPTRLPTFVSLPELIEFFDSHDMGDYWDNLPQVSFEINIQQRSRLITIDEELFDQLSEVARRQQLSTESLIHSWLKKQVAEYS